MSGEPLVLHESDVPLEQWADPVRGEVGFRMLIGDGTHPTGSLTAGVTELAPSRLDT
jgi:hypothetical protein